MRTSLLVFFLVASTVARPTVGFSQAPGSPSPKIARPPQLQSREDQWRHTPVDRAAQIDPVSPDTRAKRKNAWSRAYPLPGIVLPQGSSIGESELPKIPQSAWIIATVASHRVFETWRRTATYTEISLRVDKEILANGLTVPVGAMIDTILDGGAVREADGTILHSPSDFLKTSLQPHHTYLLLVGYNKDLNLYSIRRQWDASYKTLIPEGDHEFYFAKYCASRVSGKTLATATAAILRGGPDVNGCGAVLLQVTK